MCGIAGVFLRDQVPDTGDRRRLEAAMDRLRHRGPEHLGLYSDNGLALAHRRLSILDLSPAGHQPMRSPDGRLVIALNGEIYNYIELRHDLEGRGYSFRTATDTEVLLAAYQQWGLDCLEKTRGMFALALWDVREQTLLLARDRMGEKPLFYAHSARRLVFASEIKALLELLPDRPSLSAQGIDDYLHYQFPLEPGTALEGVSKLPAGHVLECSGGRWGQTPRSYWNVFDAAARSGQSVGLREALTSAVELTLRSDAPVGIGLSAGLDSGVIAALAAKTRRDLTAFTVGYPGHHQFDERDGARRIAECLGIPWHSAELPTEDFAAFFPQLVESLDEPIADVAAYGHYAVAKLASQHGVKVLLTGIGGDELFFGYPWVNEALRLSALKLHATPSDWTRLRARLSRRAIEQSTLLNVAANRRLPQWWRAIVHRTFDDGRIDLEHPDEWVFYQTDYHWAPAEAFAPAVYTDPFRQRLAPRSAHRLMCGLSSHRGEPALGICKLLFDSWLVSNCLALGDRVSMANSVETRMPLLDASLVETVLGYLKAGGMNESVTSKGWLREIARDLLPADVLHRPKTGFIPPTLDWITAVTQRHGRALEQGSLVEDGVLDAARLRDWRSHARPGIQRDFFLYKLTLLETWNRVVVRREPTSSADGMGAVRRGSADFEGASREGP